MEQPLVAASLLRFEGDLDLLRRQDGAGASILELIPRSGSLSRRALRLLEHEYALREQLERAWAVRPLAFADERGWPSLRLEDPDPTGRVLLEHMGRPWPIDTFLRVAIAIAGALRAMHASGLVHKDIRPGNILLSSETGRVWLMGFGLASLLPRERRSPDPPELIEGNLRYMSPEQTGRMNRSVDSRSDLYALGITFFEMLTGGLPFAASDAMGWIHCQIAMEPPRAEDHSEGVPPQIGALVAKLLEKSAETRYQTAVGVEADLGRCLEALENAGRIDSFPLGSGDLPDRLLVPEQLYGRESEHAALLLAFERTVLEGTLGVVLVSGYSGIGKSAVVNELHKVLVPQRGLFASGKFDQYRRDIPYATLAQALRQLVRGVLVEDDERLAAWRSALMQALGPNAAVMTSLIPELERVIGVVPAVPELGPTEAQNRFQRVFRDFVRVFAGREHPLALFLDDLQWIDLATLKLIEALASERGSLRLLLVGAYRSNEVDAAHPLSPVLNAIRASGVRLSELVLEPLDRHAVGQLVADTVRTTPDRAASLAGVVYEKAGGNPFFTIEFLAELAHEKLVSLDTSTSRWTWDARTIADKGYKNNVVELMAGKLVRLPGSTQAALRDLACLGNHASLATLARVHTGPVEHTEAALWDAVRAGVILRLGADFAFVHDRVHEAAYSLIAEREKIDNHLRIGRLLLASLPEEATPEAVFTVVSQFTPAADRIVDATERAKLRSLNVLAGKMARRSIAYSAARGYLATAAALSNPDAWEADYRATFELHLLLAECEFLIGNFDVAERQFETMLERARDRNDRGDIYGVRLQLYQVAGRYTQGLALTREALRLFQIEIPESESDIKAATEAACAELWQNLGGRAIASLVDAPLTSDASLPALMKILVNAGPCAFNGGPELYPLITVTGVNLSLLKGHTDLSAFSYCAYAVVLVALFKDITSGAAFAEMALRLNEKLGNASIHGSISLVHCHFVVFWKRPFADVIPLQERSLAACLETGNLSYACFNRFFAVWHLLETGLPLEDVFARSADYPDVCLQANNDALYQLLLLERQFVASLLGRTQGPLSFSDASFDEEASFAVVVRATYGCGIVLYHVMKQVLGYLHGQYRDSLAAARAAEPFLGSAMSTAIEAAYFLFRALATAAVTPTSGADERAAEDAVLADAETRYELWASECPQNFAGRAALLRAENARVRGEWEQALVGYESAVAAARKNGLVQDEALALEVAARCYEQRGLGTAARAHFSAARDAYRRWGATAKVHQLERALPYLREANDGARAAETIGAAVELLDLASVVRVLQTLTSDVALDDFVERLLRVALEDTGAQRGVLLDANGQPLAEAVAAGSGISVRQLKAGLERVSFPGSLVRYVGRAHEPFIIDDASVPGEFSADEELGRAGSVLCLPLLKHDAVVGILYLENRLAPYVFTPRRAALMKLVASQAAMSIENARLHAAQRAAETALVQARDELARVARATALGELAASIAHEVNQPLSAIVFRASTARRVLAATPPNLQKATNTLQAIAADSERAGEIIRGIRAFLTRSPAAHASCEVNGVVSDVLRLARAQLLRARVALETELADELPAISGDRVQLQQVLLNLVLNAVDACRDLGPKRNRIVVRSTLEQHTAGRWVTVSVRDFGRGIAAETRERLFEPFFTTKSSGLGMGLSISRSIIERHRGKLTASPNEDCGATFAFRIPVDLEPAPAG